MKSYGSKQWMVSGQWITVGYTYKRIGFGFSVDQYSIQLDFLFFWFGWEYK